MVRTQIQLTEEQAARLRAVAQERGLSVAELIRRSVNGYLQSAQEPTRAQRRQQALAVIGIATSRVDDFGAEHDKYLAEAYQDQEV